MSSLRPGLAALAGGALSALLFLAFQTGTVGGLVLFWMAQLPLFMVALSLGPAWGLAASGWGFGLLVMVAHLVLGMEYAVVASLPVLAVTGAALRGRKPDPALMLIALTAIVITAFIAADIVNLGVSGGLQGRIRLGIGSMLAISRQGHLSWIEAPALDRMVVFVPGIMAWVVMLIAIGNGVLAQGALSRFGWNKWGSPRMARMTMPRWTSVFLVAALVAGAAGSGEARFLGLNLAIMASVPVMFGGFGVVHSWTEKYPSCWPVVPGLYVVSFVVGWTIPLIVALGMVEQWFGLRRKMARPTEERSDG
jgi:hypothetical protein